MRICRFFPNEKEAKKFIKEVNSGVIYKKSKSKNEYAKEAEFRGMTDEEQNLYPVMVVWRID